MQMVGEEESSGRSKVGMTFLEQRGERGEVKDAGGT
jgi:hypothetical protein